MYEFYFFKSQTSYLWLPVKYTRNCILHYFRRKKTEHNDNQMRTKPKPSSGAQILLHSV